jgi:hypothetical protein
MYIQPAEDVLHVWFAVHLDSPHTQAAALFNAPPVFEHSAALLHRSSTAVLGFEVSQ